MISDLSPAIQNRIALAIDLIIFVTGISLGWFAALDSVRL